MPILFQLNLHFAAIIQWLPLSPLRSDWMILRVNMNASLMSAKFIDISIDLSERRFRFIKDWVNEMANCSVGKVAHSMGERLWSADESLGIYRCGFSFPELTRIFYFKKSHIFSISQLIKNYVFFCDMLPIVEVESLKIFIKLR